MPRIWLDYLEFLICQPRVTQTRRTFDRALRALPITQHDRIWPVYLKFAKRIGGETAIRVYRRYLHLYPEEGETFIELCIHLGRWDEAAKHLLKCLNQPEWKSPRGTPVFQLWMQLADLIVEHPTELMRGSEIRAQSILRDGIKRYPDQVGKLWTALARYFIISGEMEQARDVYEEAIETVRTIRDFTQVFDSYAEFEEGVITSLMEQEAEHAAMSANAKFNPDAQLEVDMRLERFERLMDRRPFLVNDVLLRQNPNSVKEWQKRADLWKSREDV